MSQRELDPEEDGPEIIEASAEHTIELWRRALNDGNQTGNRLVSILRNR